MSSSKKKPVTKKFLTWERRAAGVYVYLHPMIYGTGDERTIRIEKAADAIGVHIETFRPWVSTSDTKAVSQGFIEKWLPIVENMEWRDVKKLINGDFCCEMFEGLPDDSKISEEILSQFRNLLDPNGTIYVSKYNRETTISSRRSLAMNSSKVKLIKKNTKSAGRNDKGKSRKFHNIEEYVNQLIEKRIAEGDPISKGEIKEELYKHPECGPDTEFYKTKLAPSKRAGWANWFKKVLERGGGGPKRTAGCVIQLDGRRKAARNSKKRRQSASLPDVEVPRVPAMEMPRVPAIEVPQVTTLEMPRVPAMEMEMPRVPAIEAPRVPAMYMPRAPAMEAPQVPAMEAPRAPAPSMEMPRVPQISLPPFEDFKRRKLTTEEYYMNMHA